MISFANTIDIDCEPADVYAYIADLEHTPEWNWAITSSGKITPGPVAIGTQYRQTRSAPRAAVEVIEITGLEEGRRADVAGTLGPFRARLVYELVASPTGTRLTNTVELDPPVPLGPFGAMLGSRVRTSVAENLNVLKQLLEGQLGRLPQATDT
jgi:hypothetical protein